MISAHHAATIEILTVAETRLLASYEAVITQGLSSFIEVGNALAQVRDGKLYRAKFKTFESYCQERWNIDHTYAHRIMAAARVVEMLPIGNKPSTESQARPLTKLPPDEQADAWREAVETAPDGKMTAKHVAKVVEKRNATKTVQERCDDDLFGDYAKRLKEAQSKLRSVVRIIKCRDIPQRIVERVAEWHEHINCIEKMDAAIDALKALRRKAEGKDGVA